MNATVSIGSLVRARGREWVVLPSDDEEVLRLRPLGGTDDDARGLYLPLEGDDVQPASMPLPDPARAGNGVSAALLRDAVRLGFRSAAGPLRSIARIAVEPYPFQLVPLLMALKLDPVRLLIGDDVGVGKTIEATLIARELLDRGEIRRICVLCPPHLCEQWAGELREHFHLPAVEVRPGTVTALGRDLPIDRSIFEEYKVTVVSIDFIKGERRRAQFVQTCPELVIVDEAHTAAQSGSGGHAQQLRHSLLRELAADPRRHLLLTTATPHSGDSGAFASLVGLLAPELERPVAELKFAGGSAARERLARHFVQRRRADVDHYLKAHAVFPARESQERAYRLTPERRRLLDGTLAYSRELVRESESLSKFHQRVRWWAALALLRCVSSSPAAAAAALRTRAAQSERLDVVEADRLGQDAVFDVLARDEADQDDSTPGAVTGEEDTDSSERRRLLALARQADALMGQDDPKLALAETLVRDLLRDGFQPIIFCRYVATAHYVGEELRRRLKNVQVEVVTGELPAEERTARVAALGEAPRRVLVATDCLSEGINLQEHFNAMIHYDLAWNPTRHEQREGRVDRFRQPSPVVRTALIYGQDNPVDGVILKVLLRKADQIRRALGVSVPVPVDSNAVLEAILEALLQREATSPQQLSLFFDEEERRVNVAWEAAADREKATRTVFAQHSLKPEEVAAELAAAAGAAGSRADVERLVLEACSRLGAPATQEGALWRINTTALPAAVRSRAGLTEGDGFWRVCFTLPAPDGAAYLARTHPLVEALASYALDTAVEGAGSIASRCGAIRTRAVGTRTTLLLLRARFLIEETRGTEAFPMLAEECLLEAFAGDPAAPAWLERGQAEQLAQAQPSSNLPLALAQRQLQQVLEARAAWQTRLGQTARRRAEELLDAHRRVRAAAGLRGVRARVQPQGDVDVLGLYVLLPELGVR